MDRLSLSVPARVVFGLALAAGLTAGCGKKEASGPGAAKAGAANPASASQSAEADNAARMSKAQESAMKTAMEAPLKKVRVLAAVTAAANEPFKGPMGLAVDDAGNLYVADTGNARIVRCDKDGRPLGAFGGPGEGDGKFKAPFALAFGPGGNLLVLDRGTGFVQAFSKSGTFVARLVGAGSGFYNPSGIAGNASSVFVADTGTGRLLRFPSTGGAQGEELAHPGAGAGDLREPTDVFADAEGLLVVDDQRKSVLKFSADGKFQSAFDAPAAGFIRAVRLADGSVVLGTDQLPRYDKTGKVVARYGQFGRDPGQVTGPTALAADKAGNVWVADSTGRVQKLALE